MDYEITRIHNLARRGYRDSGVYLEHTVHRLAHYLDVTLDSAPEQRIITECLILPGPSHHKRLDLKDRIENVSEIFLLLPIHKSGVLSRQAPP